MLPKIQTFEGNRRGLRGGVSNIQPYTQAGHGFSLRDVVVLAAGTWVKASASTVSHIKWLGGVVSAIDGDHFLVTHQGIVSGFSGLTAGEHQYTSTTAGGVSTTPGNRPVGMSTSTTDIYVEMGQPVWAKGDVVQRHIATYDPSAKQSLSTSYTDVNGSSHEFSPVFDDSRIKYSYNFNMAIDGTTGAAMHIRLVNNGVVEPESSNSEGVTGTNVWNEGTVHWVQSLPSWGAAAPQILKLQAREYSSAITVKLFATEYFNTSLTEVLKRATLTVTEYR